MRYFGWIATLFLTVLTMLVSAAVQGAVLAIAVRMATSRTPGVRPEKLAETLIWDGAVFSAFVILSSVAGTLAVALWIRLKRGGLPFGEYLALDRAPSLRDWGLGAAALGALWAAISLLPVFFDEPEIPAYMIRVYQSASNRAVTLAALAFGVAVAGPVFEEIVFRGFLYRGIVGAGESRWRTALAITAGSIFWSVIHLQYGWYEILQIFLLGLALGAVRWKTGNLWVPIVMHAAVNALALAAVAYGD